MKRLIQSAIILASTLFLVNCGSDSNNSHSYYQDYPMCPVGQVWNGNVCVNGSHGIVPSNGIIRLYDFNSYTAGSGYYTQVQNGDMRIVNSAAYQSFLRDAMAVCDNYNWNAGSAKCSHWVNGSFQLDVTIDTNANPPRPTMTFMAAAPQKTFNYYFQAGVSGGVGFNPLHLVQNNTFSLINNSQGFEIRGYGSHWNAGGLRLIQIQVLQGTLADGYMNYDLYFPHNGQPTKFATGRLKRR